jgi:hypothetical protein
VGDIKEEVQYKNLTIRFTRTNLTFNEYSVFIDAVCAGWIRDGITWLRSKFGKEYRGHMGLLGNVLILCAVKTLCLDTVPEPSLIVEKMRLQADVAVLGAEELLIIEVKLHHERYSEFPVVETQLERQVAEMLPVLRRYSIKFAVLHLFTAGMPSLPPRMPRYVKALCLPPRRKEALDALKDFVQGLIGQ